MLIISAVGLQIRPNWGLQIRPNWSDRFDESARTEPELEAINAYFSVISKIFVKFYTRYEKKCYLCHGEDRLHLGKVSIDICFCFHLVGSFFVVLKVILTL